MDNVFNNLREFGNFKLDVGKRVLWWNDTPVNLPPKEVELLAVLTEHPGELVTKTELMDRLWADSFVEESNLSRHVYRLRRMFEERGEPVEMIETVPRRGYRFAGCIQASGIEVVIDRHSIKSTLIEEIESSGAPDAASSSANKISTRTFNKAYRNYVAAAILLAFLSYSFFFGLGAGFKTKPVLRSIAVLPFKPIGSTQKDTHRGFAIADLLISKLSNIDQFSVRPTSAVLRFEGNQGDLELVARELRVDSVVEGSYEEANGRILVIARLVRVSDWSTVWSHEFDVPERDILYTHREIAFNIANALAVDLSGRERDALAKRYSDLPDAMSMYQQGRYYWSKRDNPGLAEGLRLFRNAVKADPNFALAYVGIADSTIFAREIGEAETAVAKALELDPTLGEAYATRGFINMFHRWDWESAESDFRRSIELNPGYPVARQWYANLLMIRGRSEEARKMLLTALELDPVSPNLYTDLAQAEYYIGSLDQAEAHALKALEVSNDFLYAHGILSDVCFALGRFEEGIMHQQRTGLLLGRQPNQPPISDEMQLPEAVQKILATRGVQGYLEFADREMSAVKDKNANRFIGQAKLKLALGNTDEAMKNLEIAVTERAFLAPFINPDPVWDPLRSDPRFHKLVERLGLG